MTVIVIVALALSLSLLALVFALLLTRRIREKYAVLWIVIALCVLLLGIFPQLLVGLTALLGLQVPANLLFAMAILLLLGVALHLSWELSQAEDEIRRVAEEAAIARTEIEGLRHRLDALETTRAGTSDPGSADDTGR